MHEIVYLPLLNEGTECWRPIQALRVADDIFEIRDDMPEDEQWAFHPSSRVRCRHHVFSDGKAGLVAFELAK